MLRVLDLEVIRPAQIAPATTTTCSAMATPQAFRGATQTLEAIGTSRATPPAIRQPHMALHPMVDSGTPPRSTTAARPRLMALTAMASRSARHAAQLDAFKGSEERL